MTLDEVTRLHDRDAAIARYVQKMSIAADDYVGPARDGRGEELVVVRITAHPTLYRYGVKEFGPDDDEI